MSQVANRASFTSQSTTSPFTTVLVNGATAPANNIDYHYIIEQLSNKTIWASVTATFTATNVLAITGIEESSEADNSLPVFVGDTVIFSALPVRRISRFNESGKDGILCMGDGGIMGLNGAVRGGGGYHPVLDVPTDVMTYGTGNQYTLDHATILTSTEVVNVERIAGHPLPHAEYPPVDSMSFPIMFGQKYYHERQWTKQPVLLPAGREIGSIADGVWGIGGAGYLEAKGLGDTFLAAHPSNKITCVLISLGIQDVVNSTQAQYQAGLELLVAKIRNDMFVGNAAQSNFADVAIVICGLPQGFISSFGAAGNTLNGANAAVVAANTRMAHAETGAGWTTSTNGYYLSSTSQRLFASTVFTAYEATFAKF